MNALISRLSAACLLACATALPHSLLAAPATETAPAPLTLYEIKPASRGYLRTLDGMVEAVRQATVSAQSEGRIVDLKADAGQRVTQGALLARIDERTVAQAEQAAGANVTQAQASFTNAQLAYERAKTLRAKNFVSQSAEDQAEAGFRAAEAQLKATQAQHGQASTTRSFAAVTAPISGVIGQRHRELGELAQPGAPLFTLYDPQAMRITASLPQSEYARLSAAGKTLSAEIEIPGSGLTAPLRSQKITVIPLADQRAHVMQLRIELPANLPQVIPGLSARVTLLGPDSETLRQPLSVPTQAILRRGEITAVYVVGPQQTLQLRQIRTGENRGDQTVVLAGLSHGEKIALEPIKASQPLTRH